MNVNKKIMALAEVTGIEVEQNLYHGKKEEWITYTYADERADRFADDAPLSDRAYLIIKLYTKRDFTELKEIIKNHLEKEDFENVSVQSYYEDGYHNVVFECEITQERSK